MKHSGFSFQEKRIINALYNANRILTTTQVAKKSEMSWITANKYLRILEKRGYAMSKRIGKAIYWKLI